MKSARLILVLIILSVFLCTPLQLYAKGNEDSVVAKVGSISIVQSDLQREIQKILPMQVSFHGGLKKEKLEEIKDEALQKLIDRAYKVQYAISEEIAIAPEVVEEEWLSFKNKYSKSLNKLPAEQVQSYRADMYLSLLADKAEELAVEQNIKISDEDVKNYYSDNREKFFKPKSFTASHILVKVDPSANKEERAARLERAKGLLERARAGEDFYNLAYYESDDRSKYVGGSLGTFHANQVVPEFEKAIMTMQPGEISELVQTMYGYHIIKVDSVEEARQLDFDEASITIRKMLEGREREKLLKQWMAELQSRYPLEHTEK